MDVLTTDAGGFLSPRPVEISKDIIRKNTIAIADIQLDDLFYLENDDLDFGDKVIIFLPQISMCLVLSISNKCCQYV